MVCVCWQWLLLLNPWNLPQTKEKIRTANILCLAIETKTEFSSSCGSLCSFPSDIQRANAVKQELFRSGLVTVVYDKKGLFIV